MEIFQTCFTKSSLLWHQSQKKTSQKLKRERKLQANILDGYRWKNPQQNNIRPNLTIYWKDHTVQSSEIYSKDARMVQHPPNNKFAVSH